MSHRIVVRVPGEAPRSLPLEGALSIGRAAGNDLVLAQPRVSKRHARLEMMGGRCRVVDLGSTNGTVVAGVRIDSRFLDVGEVVVIGDAELELAPPGPEAPPSAESAARDLEAGCAAGSSVDDGAEVLGGATAEGAGAAPTAAGPRAPPTDRGAPAAEARGAGEEPGIAADPALRKEMHDRLIAALDLRRLDLDSLDAAALRARSEAALRGIVEELDRTGRVPPGVDRERLLVDVADEVLGLGPLEALLADDEVSEIMVNHAEQIFVERGGRIVPSGKTFSSNRAVLGVIERIVAPIGRRIDEASPLVDARLPDGSRVHAIIPPLALKGPCLTIRKFRRETLQAADLVRFGSLTPKMAAFLELAVRSRRNVVISGGTGSGKTTLLNVLTSFIPSDERIVTVEDAAELQIRQPHWVQLEARPPNLEGKGAITIRELVKNCLRMRPDRIVVGECRAGEALDMLQAMNTGHDGSLTTLHANSPRDALSRLETMCLMSGMNLPVRAIREQVSSAVDLVVQQTRFPDGTRRVTHVAEVSGMEGEVITLQEIFRFEQQGFDAEGRMVGAHRAAGFVPRFCEELARRGVAVDLSIFREDR
ncbi:MAG TPA: ATPase, T2SS/T4P/T4SS family [Vulgatibacter sp.]|nr:ATPase, T2SS/T4P/T4SS family [Vulgatibacter sp.]